MRTRLVVGLVLAAVVGGILVGDQFLYPWYPFLLASVFGVSVLNCRELLDMLAPDHRPPRWLLTSSVLMVLLANGPAFIIDHYYNLPDLNPWFFVLGTFVAVVIGAFLFEMARFREPGQAVVRIAMLVWATAYLALLPSFLLQICWPPVSWTEEQAAFFRSHSLGTLGLTLTVFVPKVGDIGAYLIGRLIGRHRMTPYISPKKTWEGFGGSLVFSVLAAVVVNRGFWVSGWGPLLRGDDGWSDLAAVGCGLTVGVAGVLGDLAESLIKREGHKKDASASIPGFGGVLDVADSVIFAAPVAYCWLRFLSVVPGPVT